MNVTPSLKNILVFFASLRPPHLVISPKIHTPKRQSFHNRELHEIYFWNIYFFK